jgi:Leucine-rich repeat (LRR) protein
MPARQVYAPREEALGECGRLPKLTYTTPPPSLMRELREVALDAAALAEQLAAANRLPLDFPAEQLLELVAELQSLPMGTAEGCRRPLEYARARLPAIRRQFIKTDAESKEAPTDKDSPPPLTRGMTIDLRIGALVNSVTTALDEYRSLASVRDDDAADTAPSHEIDTTSPNVVSAMAAARNTEQMLDGGVLELERITSPDSATADNLKRQMRDTRGLLSLSRIELRMPAFVPRWYQRMIVTVGDYPRILKATASTMKASIDVARPFVNAWHRFEHGFSSLVLDSIEHAAGELSAVATKWETERAEQKGHFELSEVRRMILAGQGPPTSWRPLIKSLDFTRLPLRDLSPLANLAALQSLNLSSTLVSDVAPLAKLAALQSLNLNATRVSNIAPLAKLAALQTLNLNGTRVNDVASLAGLLNLQRLYLNGTRIRDVTQLSKLPNLQRLYLGSTRVSDIKPLARLTALQYLDLNGTGVTDVAPLAGMTTLRHLYLNGTGVSDVRPLASLPNLQSLRLSSTRVSDIKPLGKLTTLESLHINDMQYSGSELIDLLQNS